VRNAFAYAGKSQRQVVLALISFAVGACFILVSLAMSNLAPSGNIRPPDTNSSVYDYPGSPFAHGYILGSIGRRFAP